MRSLLCKPAIGAGDGDSAVAATPAGTRERWTNAVLACLLIGHAGLLAYNGWSMAPTIDEPAHLAAGLYFWRTGTANLYTVNPPLVKVLAAVPAALAGAREDWKSIAPPPARREFQVGSDLVQANGPRLFWLLTLARWACIPFSLLGACICWLWTRQVAGETAGLIAAALWCSSPTILGHGALITADVASAAVGVLAGYLYWRWLQSPDWERTWQIGGALGLTWLVKLTWIVLPAIWAVLWAVVFLRRDRRPEAVTALGRLFAAGGIAVVVLNLGYGGDGAFTRLGAYQFESRALGGKRPASSGSGNRFQGTLAASLPVPLPQPFVQGIDSQKQDFEDPWNLYFAGETRQGGWLHFYLAALLLKETPGCLSVLLTALAAAALGRRPGGACCAIWLPGVALLAFVSLQTNINFYRYCLPALPYLLVSAACAASEQGAGRWRRGFVAAAGLASVCSGVGSVPYSLSYVNLFGGGTVAGDRWFVDANYDWGQDLFEVRRWQAAHPEAGVLWFAYFGACDPDVAGVRWRPAPRTTAADKIAPGHYAVSATALRLEKAPIIVAGGGRRTAPRELMSRLRTLTPVARCGPSILIFRVD